MSERERLKIQVLDKVSACNCKVRNQGYTVPVLQSTVGIRSFPFSLDSFVKNRQSLLSPLLDMRQLHVGFQEEKQKAGWRGEIKYWGIEGAVEARSSCGRDGP